MAVSKKSNRIGLFLKTGNATAILMVCGVVIALLVANLPVGVYFDRFLQTSIGFTGESIHLNYSILSWINDGLMAIFFLLVGLEIKRELVKGELSSFRKASLPIVAAFGGAVLPAVIYFVINRGTDATRGWGIPMATDIAFALAIMTFLGSRVPHSLKVFLSALAIADDLMAIIVIAFFYSAGLDFMYLSYAAAVVALLMILNYTGVTRLEFYLIPGLLLWYFIHQSGIHATIAGILTAFTIPVNGTKQSPSQRLEHRLLQPVNLLILPLFALVNTNIRIEPAQLNNLINPLSIGILAGLLIGKPIGISAMAWLSVTTGVSTLPVNTRWPHIIGAGLLGGIGFTMSLFIALLSFNDNGAYLAEAKLVVLIASVLAATGGTAWLISLSKRVPR